MSASTCEISELIKGLFKVKASGIDSLSSEHLKYASLQLPTLLALFTSTVLIHGYLPLCLIKSVIVPIVKDKNKRISDKLNYRPIGLSNSCTRIVEIVIFNRMNPYLRTNLASRQNMGLTCVCTF